MYCFCSAHTLLILSLLCSGNYYIYLRVQNPPIMNKIYAIEFVLDFSVRVKQLKKGKATHT